MGRLKSERFVLYGAGSPVPVSLNIRGRLP